MSVQNFTKHLRDKSVPILDRMAAAQGVLEGSTPLNLPQKPVVILDWVFSALSTEASARSAAGFWVFLAKVWPKCDADSQSKIARSYKLPNILLDTWKEDQTTHTMDAIDAALELVLASTLLGCNSDALAGSLVLGYAAQQAGRATNILPILEKQLVSRTRIFKKSPKVLETLCGVPNNTAFLVDYFMSRDVDAICPEPYISETMAAVCAAGVQIGERFTQLASKYPRSLDKLLGSLGETKLPNERETLKALVEQQVLLYNWPALEMLLERVPVEVVGMLTSLFAALESQFNEAFAIALLQKCAATRKLNEFATHWGTETSPEWFSPRMTAVMAGCLEQLSKAQLVELLEGLQKNGCLHILPKLSFRAATGSAVEAKLLELLEFKDPQITFAVLSLWPSISADHPETTAKIEALESLECALLLRERGVEVSIPESNPLDAGLLVMRFYKVLENTRVIGRLNEAEAAAALGLADIWEHREISSALLDHYIAHNYKTAALEAVPLVALSKKHREALLVLGWKQRNLGLVDRLLKAAPRSTECEAKPKMLLEMAAHLEESQAQLLMEVALKLVRSETYAKQLHKLTGKPSGKLARGRWHETCLAVAATVGTGGQGEPLVEMLESKLKAGRDLGPSLVCLEYLQRSGLEVSAAVLGGVLGHDRERVFRLLCKSTNEWQAITACFIYTGCHYLEPFLAFVEGLEPATRVLLVRECIRGRHYKAVKALFSEAMDKEEVVPFVTLMVQRVYAEPELLDERQAVEFFELAAQLVRENSWVLTQFSLESLIMIIPKITSRQFSAAVEHPVELYSSLCFFLGQTLLFQRHRLQSRNHLILAALSGLLRSLSGTKLNNEQRQRVGNLPRFVVESHSLGESVAAAESFLRVITIFCDPPQRSVRENSGKNNLTSSVARIRRYVAKTAGVLVANYATVSLQYGFSSAVAPTLNRAIFTVFVVLGSQDLRATMAAMDNASRAYIKSVYDSYQAMGKWKKD